MEEFKQLCEKEFQLNPEFKVIEQDIKQKIYMSYNTLSRFFKARDNKQQEALEMWKNYVKWHFKERPDLIQYQDIKSILEKEVTFILGFDKQGQGVLYCLAKNAKYYTFEENDKVTLFILEQATRISDQKGTTKFTVVFERLGFTRADLTNEALKKIKHSLQILQNYYPERLAHLLILNANWVFKIAFNILKVFFSKNTLDKLKILDESAHLNQYIDQKELDKWYNGDFQKCLELKNFINFNESQSLIQNSQNNQNIIEQSDQQFYEAYQVTQQDEGTSYRSLLNDSQQFYAQKQLNNGFQNEEIYQQEINLHNQQGGGCCSGGECQIF